MMTPLRQTYLMPNTLVVRIVEAMTSRGLKLALAESLTGGALASAVVDVPGASAILLGSVVAYDTALKRALLGVDESLLANSGAVDSQVAAQMAAGARSVMAKSASIDAAHVYGLACTGVAGPDAQGGKPVGTVYIAMDAPGGAQVYEFHLSGSRAEIRSAVVGLALRKLSESLGL
jgi:nicotinamide-nucleotide amidase